MRFVLAICCSLAHAFAWAGGEPSTPDFSKYRSSTIFDLAMMEETNAVRHLRASNLVIMTEFFRNGDWARKSYVDESGVQRLDSCELFRVGGGYSHVSDAQLVALKSAIHELPATNALPAIDDLVIVSFRQGTNWITRSYNKRTLSKPMSQVYDIMRQTWQPSFTVQ